MHPALDNRDHVAASDNRCRVVVMPFYNCYNTMSTWTICQNTKLIFGEHKNVFFLEYIFDKIDTEHILDKNVIKYIFDKNNKPKSVFDILIDQYEIIL